jgi:hypothetical protein
MPLAKLKHIVDTHYQEVQVKFHHFNEDFRYSGQKAFERLLERRKFVEEFCSKVRQVSGHGTEIPLRNIQPVCACLYKGDINDHHYKLSKIHRYVDSQHCIVLRPGIEVSVTQRMEVFRTIT